MRLSLRWLDRCAAGREASYTPTLRDADRIFVFDSGQLVEIGACDELLQRGGIFSKLVTSAEKGAKNSGNPVETESPYS
jgi:ATP-binding cassette subfamily B (MDR/TAP) protein 1